MNDQGSLQSGFLHPIIINYRPPAWLFYGHLVIYCLAIYCVFESDILLEYKAICLLFVSYGLSVEITDHLQWKFNRVLRTLKLDREGNWWMTTESDHEVKLKLVCVGFYSPYLIVLRFRYHQFRQCSFVLVKNSAEEDTLRRLRVRLLLPVD